MDDDSNHADIKEETDGVGSDVDIKLDAKLERKAQDDIKTEPRSDSNRADSDDDDDVDDDIALRGKPKINKKKRRKKLSEQYVKSEDDDDDDDDKKSDDDDDDDDDEKPLSEMLREKRAKGGTDGADSDADFTSRETRSTLRSQRLDAKDDGKRSVSRKGKSRKSDNKQSRGRKPKV